MKGIIRRLRPSPAMVVACVALLFAMTGAGYAAGMLGPNTVGTKQLKKNAVVSSKVKNHSLLRADFKAGQIPAGPQGPAGPAGAPGAAGPPGPAGPGARWVVVNPAGTIAVQSGGLTVSHPQTGIYIVNYGTDVSRMYVTATPGTAGDAAYRGALIASSCAAPGGYGSLIGCPTTNAQNYAFVATFNAGETALADHSFNLAVMGPAGAGAGPARPSRLPSGPLSR